MFLLARIYAVDLSANAQKYVKTTKNTKYPNIASVNVRTHKVWQCSATQSEASLKEICFDNLQTPNAGQVAIDLKV